MKKLDYCLTRNKDEERSNIRRSELAEKFIQFAPFHELLFECSRVINEHCSSFWLYNIPNYNNRCEEKVFKFRTKQNKQSIPLITIAAFKYHFENIRKLGEHIFQIRNIRIWIVNQEQAMSRLPSIFEVKSGIQKLALDLQSNKKKLQRSLREMEKLGSLTCRVNLADQPTGFEVRSLFTMNQVQMNCILQENGMYTVVEGGDTYLWKIGELNQFLPSLFFEAPLSEEERHLVEEALRELSDFEAMCLTRIYKDIFGKINQSECSSEDKLDITVEKNNISRLQQSTHGCIPPKLVEKKQENCSYHIYSSDGEREKRYSPLEYDSLKKLLISIKEKSDCNLTAFVEKALHFIETLECKTDDSYPIGDDSSARGQNNRPEFADMANSYYGWSSKLTSERCVENQYDWRKLSDIDETSNEFPTRVTPNAITMAKAVVRNLTDHEN